MRKNPPGHRDKPPTQEELRETFWYDEITGKLFRRKSIHRNLVGKPSGCVNALGYLHVSVRDKQYLAHRLIWVYLHGTWPRSIDHVNGNKTDNRRDNLRNCTQAQNGQNRTVKNKNNRSGIPGVSWYSSRGKWTAGITVNRKTIHLGYFDTKETAAMARAEAKKSYHEFHSKDV